MEKIKIDKKRKKKNEENICEDNGCEATSYAWEHSNGDTYYCCPLHWYEGFAHDIDQTIRDCWPINWKLSKPQQEVINYIREEVNSLLRETSRNYQLFSDIEKKNKKQSYGKNKRTRITKNN